MAEHYPSMVERLLVTAERYPAYGALDYFGHVITYGELVTAIKRCASAWQKRGVQPGERVLLCLPNLPAMVLAIYSLNYIGAVSCLVHPLSTPQELSFYLEYTESRWIVTLDLFYPSFREVIASNPQVKAIVVPFTLDLPPLPRFLSLARKGSFVLFRRKGYHFSWTSFLAEAPTSLSPFSFFPEQPALMLFTGGTTGTPKGVLLSNTHCNALADQVLSQVRVPPQEASVLGILPFFHGFGLGVCMHPTLLHGGRCILVPRFSRRVFIDAVLKRKPAYLAGVPTHFEALVNSSRFCKTSFSYLRGAVCGGDSVPPLLIHRFNQFVRDHGGAVTLRQGYGLTECVSACSIMPEGEKREGSVGLPLPGNRFKIVSPGTVEPLAPHEIGEICVHGPTVMLGYYQREEETAQVLRLHPDGLTWLHTGDLGYLDEEGYLYFVGRLKRLIKCSGFAVYPSQVENVLLTHPQVAQACVVGSPDPYTMNRVKAFVVLRGKREDERKLANELKDYVAKRLTKWSVPAEIVFVHSLPLTRMGKVDYQELERMETK